MKYTFYSLLEQFKISIPLIQRDYAQGRDGESELRNNFIDKLKETIELNGEKLNLDFIYGYIENVNDAEKLFIPLDGQQRLTTLWLMHWYFACKENKNEIEKLIGFSYETRVSSKRFCEALVNNPIHTLDKINDLKEFIIDASWFMASWINDPTVVSMLNMLQTIHLNMYNCTNGWTALVKDKKITFEFIDIKADEFKLTDELYIKMNSRGKPLTDFENFKAQFASLMSSDKTNFKNEFRTYDKVKVNYQQYFSFKIDGVWMDLFWKYKDRVPAKLDDQILNFIYYISEFLYFKNCVIDSEVKFESSFKFIEQVYLKKENVDFLFDALNLFCNIENLDAFFEEIFTTNEESNKVNLFDDPNINLFERSIGNFSFDVRIKVILYAVIEFSIENKSDSNKIIDFIRVIRNLVFNVKQINQKNRLEYATNLRIQNAQDYSKFIDSLVELVKDNPGKSIDEILVDNTFQGFPKHLILDEIRKSNCYLKDKSLKHHFVKLENSRIFIGDIDVFQLESKNIIKKIDTFNTIWSEIDTSLIIQAFLTTGNYFVNTHDNSSIGKIMFFGSKNYWNRIFTTADKNEKRNISKLLNIFLDYCMANAQTAMKDKLNALIAGSLYTNLNWQYYFISYPNMIFNKMGMLNLYAFGDVEKNSFQINQLGNAGKQPLLSYHANPYLAVIYNFFSDNNEVSFVKGRYSDSFSHLIIKDSISIFANTSGFRIKNEESVQLSDEIISNFKLKEIDDDLLLEEIDDRDGIILAKDFINELINEI